MKTLHPEKTNEGETRFNEIALWKFFVILPSNRNQNVFDDMTSKLIFFTSVHIQIISIYSMSGSNWYFYLF